ncbi:hypothetical protein CN978_29735 [Priestia megaterium]|uniref:hypothetical protein n=1 Tax=Priestia megaterium TaxID=1404 RepID=UPI000BFCFBB0|nr:hypothetical protein [Priestia megaterium]PGN53888.1 hypothetical protein CN978_29735 [Priestia megaterium]
MINITVFTQNGCRNCEPVKLYLNDITPTLTGVEFKYINLDEVLPEIKESYKAKHRLMAAPTLIFERNGHEMARTTGITAIDDFLDCLEHARNAK